MDIERLDRLDKKNKLKKLMAVVVIVLLIFILFWLYSNDDRSKVVKINELWVAEVKKGSLTISAQAVGKLKAVDNFLVTSQVSGTVTKIEKNIGSLVEQGDVILTLDSEQLKQKIKETQFTINQAIANHHILKSDLSMQMLNNEAIIFKLKNDVSMLKLEAEAKESLNTKGIVSEVDMKKTRLEVENKAAELNFEKQKLKSLKQSVNSKIEADSLIIEQLKQKLNAETQLLESMKIKASKDGIINNITVALGEHVAVGQSLLELSDNDKLSAVLQINESFGDQIKYGQSVEINVLNTKIQAHIKSINPQIKNNSIELELAFNELLPPGARADMNVTGAIIFSEIKDTLWVTRPRGVNENNKHNVFVLDKNDKSAIKKEVEFGQQSNNKIEILNGLELGQSVLVNAKDLVNQDITEIEIIK